MQTKSISDKPSSAESDTVVISFRAPIDLVAQLDELASRDQRTRANFIVNLLSIAITKPCFKMTGNICFPDTKWKDSVYFRYSGNEKPVGTRRPKPSVSVK